MSAISIGVTGHQRRPGIDWSWTEREIVRALERSKPVSFAITSLAVGADTLFARCALALEIQLLTVIPISDYDGFFKGPDLAVYQELLTLSASVVELRPTGSREEAFLAAGVYVADRADLLIAVWDGKPAEGVGGTADVVRHAVLTGKEVLHLNPIDKTSRTISDI